MQKIVLLITLFLMADVLQAKPQYTAMTGNKCQNCHFTSQGGGIRNELGWYSNNDVSLVKPKDIGLGGVFNTLVRSNKIADDLVTFGVDYRLQSARLGGPGGSKRETFNMQLTPYLGFSPVEWLDVYGQYNFIETLYPGQEAWSAAAIIKPAYWLPKLKVGYIQPSIGVRYDDHTLLVRQVAGFARATPIVPPDYAEYGAEMTYEGLKWLSLTVGVFDAKNMSDITLEGIKGTYVPLVDKNEVSTLFRVAFWPQFFKRQLNTNIGASYFSNGDYGLTNIFLHAGLTDRLAFLGEYAISDKDKLRETNNLLLELSYHLMEGLYFSARYEKANSDILINPENPLEYKAEQYVVGMNIFLLPYIEIRPEYRIYDRANFESYSSQWAVQLHCFY